jgi:hypothetical protein
MTPTRAGSLGVVLLSLGLLMPSSARANLIGDSIDLSLDFTDPQHTDQSVSDVVGEGFELEAPFFGQNSIAAGTVAVDVGGSSILLELISFSESVGAGGPFLPAFSLSVEDLDLIDEPGFVIVDVVASPGNAPGFSVSFVGGDVLITYAGIPPSPNNPNPTTASGLFELETAFVPEPSVGLLVGAGLALLATGVRRRD